MKNETIDLKLTKNEFDALSELFLERYFHALNKPNFYSEPLNNVYDKIMIINGLNPINGQPLLKMAKMVKVMVKEKSIHLNYLKVRGKK